MTISGAETHRDTLLARTKVPKESWPQKPAPEPPKRVAKDSVQVTLRGQPVSEAVIKAIDGDTPAMPGAQFYDATFKLLSNDTVFRVYKSHHKPEELQRECNAIREARDVQVSGIMMSASKDDDYDMAVLADHWTPITEEADAAP